MLEELKGKKIAIVGLGKNNEHLARFLAKNKILFSVIDGWKSPEELSGRLEGFEVIFRSPGLPFLSEPIQRAKKAGAVVTSQTKLFFKLCPCKIIGVTGTKGKGTTCSLLAAILENSGKKTWLAGNIGKDPFQFMDSIETEDLVVLELSSFQLQDLEQSPFIAVVLSITPDHLDHHATMDEYLESKSSILKYQSNTDYAFIHPDLPEALKNCGAGKKILIDPIFVSSYKRKLLGVHNLDNIAAAVQVAKVMGVDDGIIRQTVADFEPLPHHLSIVRTVEGVTYVDDGCSTNIEPTIAAIDAFDSKMVLIIGGSDKGLDFRKLCEFIKKSEKIRGLVVFGEVTDKILDCLKDYKGRIQTGAARMDEIVSQANVLAQSGDIVLFSPGTSSFDLFKNMYDRSEQFVSVVNKL